MHNPFRFVLYHTQMSSAIISKSIKGWKYRLSTFEMKLFISIIRTDSISNQIAICSIVCIICIICTIMKASKNICPGGYQSYPSKCHLSCYTILSFISCYKIRGHFEWKKEILTNCYIIFPSDNHYRRLPIASSNRIRLIEYHWFFSLNLALTLRGRWRG